MEKDLKMLALELELILTRSKCALISTYDYSRVIIEDKESNNSEVIKHTSGVYAPTSSEIDEDDELEEKRQANKHIFDICVKEVELFQMKNKVKIETTYDMSRAILIDSYGNYSNV